MTKLKLQMKLKQSNISCTTTSLARRALLLMSFLVVCMGNVWGVQKDLPMDGNRIFLQSSQIPSVFNTSEIILRAYVTPPSWDPSAQVGIYIANSSYSQFDFLNTARFYDDAPEYNPAGYFEFKLSLEQAKIIYNSGLVVTGENNASLNKVTYEKPDYFVGSLKPRTDGKPNTGSSPESVDIGVNYAMVNLGKAYSMLSELEDLTAKPLKYVRISLEHNGEAIPTSGMLSFTEGNSVVNLGDEHGFYIYEPSGLQEGNLPSVTLTLTAAELEDYQIVTVWSTDFVEDGNIVDNIIIHEPDWDLQYVYAFEYPFKGDASNAAQMESTFKIVPSLQSNEMTLSFDYSESEPKIVLKNLSNNDIIAKAPVAPEFLKIYPDASAQIENNFYIRWFLQKNGVETYISGSLSDATNGSYNTPAKERYYYYWDAGKDNISRSLNDILKINLKGAILDPLTDYDLVFTIATKRDGINYVDGELTHEPDEIAYQYTFHLEDKPFEAENISTVKTIYKTALYDKTTGEITIDLFSNYNDVLADLEVATLSQIPTYLRWYVTDSEGNVVSMSEKNLSFNGNGKSYNNNDPYGYYMHTEWGIGQWDAASYNPIITLPASEKETGYNKYQVVCVITTDMTGMLLPDCEPTNMQVKYVFSQLIPKDELETLFVHYKGLSGRDFIQGSGAGNVTQQYWDEKTGRIVETEQDIRQGVHTWEYDIYVVPGGGPYKLILPFQWYYQGRESGNADEPRGYIRWYDWNTDTKVVSDGSFTFAKVEGSELKERNRGLFGIKISNHPIHDNIGVTFTPEAGFDGSVDIACDVSKYSDGIMEVNNQNYYLHEPTLSNRYIFHIRPASEMADSLDAAKQRLIDAGSDAEALYKAMSTLKEDKGKVVVSIANDNSVFALRFDQQELGNYILNNGNSYVSANEVQWYAYYDNRGTITEPEPISWSIVDETKRIYSFTYEKVKNINNGNKFHIVGYVGQSGFNAKTNSGVYAPVAHYELSFIDAPPIPADKIIAGTVEEEYINRTEPYMQANNYVRAGIVDFDGNPETNPNVVGREKQYYSTPNWDDAPTSSADNSTYEPFLWGDIQYGFCYPPLTETIMNGYSHFAHYVSPEHGEYIILKSMNYKEGEKNISAEGATPYNYNLWGPKLEIHDYTYYATNGAQHGSFLYTDASDESRSIATIPFTAEDLCAGSSIYFTAVVANETQDYDHVFPQLLIRIVGINEKGERERIVAFHTGELDNQHAGVEMGKWYQIYGASTLPKGFDSNITQFEAEVINYASGTWGADFAFDQFVIYTTSAKVLLTQTSNSSCSDQDISNNEVKIYMEAEGLQNAFELTDELRPIYWRIYERDASGSADRLITGLGMYPQYSSDGTLESGDTDSEKRNTYGIAWVKPNFTDADLNQITDEHPYGWYKTTDGNYFFQIANKSFSALERGKNYYVSVYDPCTEEEFDASIENSWGKKKIKCSIYSDFFIPRRQYVTYIVDPETGKEGGELTMECGSNEVAVEGIQMVLKVPDPDDKITGFKSYEVAFDYAICPMAVWGDPNEKLEGFDSYTYQDLALAWRDYRDKWLDNNKNLTLNDYSNDEHSEYKTILEYATQQNILVLANSEKFEYRFTKSATNQYHVICLPIEQTIDGKTVCDAFEVIFNIKSSGGPSLTLGFEDVTTYPDGNRVVRVGKQQLVNMQNGGFLLHIPVNTFKVDTNGEEKTGTLEIVSQHLELLAKTGTNQTDDANVTTTVNVATFEGVKEISSTNMYISINFHGANVDFKEGFTYHMFFQVKNKEAGEGACEAPVNFLLKVVPKYVTWNDGDVTGDNQNENINWNNDKNWSRSKGNELHKADYVNNAGTTPRSFVPMKFTYVTIPSDNKAPKLTNLSTDNEGIYTDTNVDGYKATDNIQYDLMVKLEELCEDENHKVDVKTNIYDCEKYYGNICKEIYFKPGAELLHQEHLTYEKAWVEKELTPNKWYLMSTPLQYTYAGDMYVPKSGRQETEAFKAIEFDTDNYSRTAYPFYQRTWGAESTVYTQSNQNYSASLGYGSVATTTTMAEWGHTYNDLQEDYNEFTGFSIRANRDAANNEEKALIRLPKDDKKYYYYNYKGEAVLGSEVVVRGENAVTGRFVTDGKDDGEITTNITALQQVGGYILVGNPYMASLDMAAFFGNENNKAILTGSFWRMENEVEAGLETGKIKPLEAFFVKLKDEITDITDATVIKFTADMMTDGNTEDDGTSQTSLFTLTASNGEGRSMATVSVGDEAKSVETLFDSNLSDMPMVYTVADGRAVSINQVTELDKPMAFGVACAANDELVEVVFSDIEQLTAGEVYVVDAMTGSTQQLTEGSSYSIQPNDYGRYFLTFAGNATGIDETVQQGIIISVRGNEVTVSSNEELTQVRALSLSGMPVYQSSARTTTASFSLSSGVYIIKAEDAAGKQQTVKVIVR